MARPCIRRKVMFKPGVTYYKPAGVPIRELEEVELRIDEFEAVRLSDSLGLKQEEAAKRMKVSQPTFYRILSSARKKIAEAITEGKAIRIMKP